MKKNNARKYKIPELLAPAGSKEAFIAAVEAGADAIYTGGEFLNARMGAENFSDEELEHAIDFAHKRKVKVFITVNTLIKDKEMHEALAFCRRVHDMGADALIIQDLGLGYLIKKHLPDIPIHMSTQGSIYDRRGVEAAADLGYKRVVLARELNLNEIKNICQSTDTEIEVFCHGAICICYSGQCQMSRAIGGRSANRGACAQPCRLFYGAFDGTGDLSDKGYLLSPADNSLIDYLGEISEAGVTSIKIEGRMKSPEYVGTVTSIYRKYLDEYSLRGAYKVSNDDRKALAQIFNRDFTAGYLEGDIKMSGDIPKNKGIYVGNVVEVERATSKEERYVITAKVTEDISLGDTLEIREPSFLNAESGASKAPSGIVTLLEKDSEYLKIGDIKGKVKKGDSIFKIISKKQNKEAEVFYKNKTWDSGNFIRKTHIDVDVISHGDGMITLVAMDKESGNKVSVEGGPFDIAERTPTDEARIEDAIRKTGGTAFEVNEINFKGEFIYFIPVSKLNELRRDCIAALENMLCFKRVSKPIQPERLKSINASEGAVELFFMSIDDFMNWYPGKIKKDVPIKVLLPAVELIKINDEVTDHADELGVEVIPYISNISRGEENKIIEKNLDEVVELAERNGIYVGNLNWIKEFINAGATVYGDFGLNVYNQWTEEALKSLGVKSACPSLEKEDMSSAVSGHIPLMVLQHNLSAESIMDRKGVSYKVVKREFSDQVMLIRDVDCDIEEAIKKAGEEKVRVRVYM